MSKSTKKHLRGGKCYVFCFLNKKFAKKFHIINFGKIYENFGYIFSELCGNNCYFFHLSRNAQTPYRKNYKAFEIIHKLSHVLVSSYERNILHRPAPNHLPEKVETRSRHVCDERALHFKFVYYSESNSSPSK